MASFDTRKACAISSVVSPATERSVRATKEVTKERIPEMDADRIFYFSNDLNDEESVANLNDWLNDPLWLNLEGVRTGNAG